MPEYRIRATGELVSDLQSAFPTMSIPMPVRAEDLEVLEVDPVLNGPMPETGRFQRAVRDGAEQDGQGKWMTRWAIFDWPQEEIDAEIANGWAMVRGERDQALAASDWTQLLDTPLTDEERALWAAYRQAWRDITTQPDPFDLERPTAPGA